MAKKKEAIGTSGLDRVFGKINKTIARLEDQAQKSRIVMLDIAKIKPNPHQPRKKFDAESINFLAQSIKRHGLLQPILVTSDGGINYVLIAGERRFKAVQILKQKQISAHILDHFDWKQAMTLALIENIQRENLSAIEEAEAYFKLMTDQNLTQQELADAIGKTRVYIANLTRLIKLPANIKKLLLDGTLHTGQARPLIALIDQPLVLNNLVQEIIKHRWTSQMVERKVKALLHPITTISTNKHQSGIMSQLEDSLTQRLKTKVIIKNRELLIQYTSIAHLNRLLAIMNLLEKN